MLKIRGHVGASSSLRRARRAGVVLVAGGSLFLAATPAQAAAAWPATGYIPKCDTVIRESSDWAYWDRTPPTIKSFKAPKYIALTSVAKAVTLGTARVTDACSGVVGMDWFYTFSGSSSSLTVLTPDNHWFDATLSYKTSLNLSTLGALAWQSLLAADRYSDFKLSVNHKTLLSSTPQTSSPEVYATEELPAGIVTYLVRKTYASTPSRSRSSVHSGTNVTLASHLTVATPTVHANLAGAGVKLQRRYPGGAWVTIGSFTTTAGGNATFHINPTKTASYHVLYAGRFAAPWNAPVTSTAVTVTVT